jgi:hypothetical protein
MDEIPPNILHCKSCDSEYILNQNFDIVYYKNGEKKTESIQKVYDNIKIKYSDIYNLSHEVFNEDKKDIKSSVGKLIYSAEGQLWIEENTVFKKYIKGHCLLGDISFNVHDDNNYLEIPLDEIGAATIESNYKLQIYNEINKSLYQVTFDNDSALKWQDILENILTHQFNKQIITR